FAARMPRSLGSTAYLAGTARALVRNRPVRVRMCIDDEDCVEMQRCHHITIANGRYFGGGLQIAPGADASDGLLDVIAVADVRAIEIARALPRLFRATHLDHPDVRHWQASHLRIETTPPALIETEGEVWTDAPITFSVAKHALTWVEPV